MIARIWHGVVEMGKAEKFLDHLKHTGLTDYKATEGNRGVYVLRRVEGNRAHFLLITFWDSIEAIRRFAGEDAERARYYPAGEEYLLEKEQCATHYEVLA
jgi:heme-degrading monooxygenase HmoA